MTVTDPGRRVTASTTAPVCERCGQQYEPVASPAPYPPVWAHACAGG